VKTDAARSYYPVFLDLRGRLVLIVGGGPAAETRARSLSSKGADVVVITDAATPTLLEMETDGQLTLEQRGYVRGDVEGAFMVFVVGVSEEIARAVYAEAEERGALVNVAGSEQSRNFIVPSIVHRGGLQIAVSTSGVAPSAAKRVRRRLSDEFGPEWEPYVALLGRVRALALMRMPDQAAFDGLFERIEASDLLERVAAGKKPSAAAVYEEFAAVPVEPAEAEGVGEAGTDAPSAVAADGETASGVDGAPVGGKAP
jgi:precorrin-2 dehydrogenase/sirohydrochlorin ferrochelatase